MPLRIAAIHPPVSGRNIEDDLDADHLLSIAEKVNSGEQCPAVMISHQGSDELTAAAHKLAEDRLGAAWDQDFEQFKKYFADLSGTDWHKLTIDLYQDGKLNAPSVGRVTKILVPSDVKNGWWYAVVDIRHPGALALLNTDILSKCSMHTTTITPELSNFIELSTCAVPLRQGCRFLKPEEVIMAKASISDGTRDWLSKLDPQSTQHFNEAASATLTEEMADMRKQLSELKESRNKEQNAYADSLHSLTRQSAENAVDELFDGEDSTDVKDAVGKIDFDGMSADGLGSFQKMMTMFGKQASALRNRSMAQSDDSSRKRSRSSPTGSSVPDGGKSAPPMTMTIRDRLLGKFDADM